MENRAVHAAAPAADQRTAEQEQETGPSLIFEIAKVLATQQDLQTTLSQLLFCLIETLDTADTGVLMLYDPSDERLTVRAARGYNLDTLRLLRLAPGEATCGRTFETGEIQLYPTFDAIAKARANLTSPNREVVYEATTGSRPALSAICIPLFTGQKKVGVLMLESRQKVDGFTSQHTTYLRTAADLIALAIENARLRSELQSTQALEEANRLKAELISTLAHEMRTPLTSIKGYSTALLMEETSFAPQTQREFLQIIDEECDVLQDLIHDLLESSIIDAGLLKLEPQPVMVPRLARNVINDTMRRAKKHQFVVDFPEHFPIVDADPHRVEQVLRNLVDNAVKYSPQGGLVVVRGEVRKDEVVISVADQGVGIAPENLPRLTESFFTTRREVGGTGLGLSVSSRIVSEHGGTLSFESTPGVGTRAILRLPVAPEE